MKHTLTPEQTQAVDLLMTGETTCSIAKILGIGRNTLWRWRKLPAFERALAERQEYWRDAMREEMAVLIDLSINALKSEMKVWSVSTPVSALNVLRMLKPDQLFAPPPAAAEPSAPVMLPSFILALAGETAGEPSSVTKA